MPAVAKARPTPVANTRPTSKQAVWPFVAGGVLFLEAGVVAAVIAFVPYRTTSDQPVSVVDNSSSGAATPAPSDVPDAPESPAPTAAKEPAATVTAPPMKIVVQPFIPSPAPAPKAPAPQAPAPARPEPPRDPAAAPADKPALVLDAGWAEAWTQFGTQDLKIVVAGREVTVSNHQLPAATGHLLSKAAFGDFLLHLQFRAETGRPLTLVSRAVADAKTFHGYALEVRHESVAGQAVLTTRLTITSGSRAVLVLNDGMKITLPLGEWHDLDMAWAGNRLRVSIAGKEVIDYTDVGRTFTNGPVGFQYGLGSTTRVRDVAVSTARLRPIPAGGAGGAKSRWVLAAKEGDWRTSYAAFQMTGPGKWLLSAAWLDRVERLEYREKSRNKDTVQLEPLKAGKALIVLRPGSLAVIDGDGTNTLTTIPGDWQGD